MHKDIKKIIIILVIITFTFQFKSSIVSAIDMNYIKLDQNDIVHIPDKNLKSSMNDILHKSENSEITKGELSRISQLNLSNKDITNLEGLQYCTGLLKLDLSYNNITDIKHIQNIENIIYLDLTSNNIRSIEPIANMHKLKYLYISSNNISDISALQSLVNIEELYAKSNKIYDFRPLSNLKKLRHGDCVKQVIELSHEYAFKDSIKIENIFLMPDGNHIDISNINEEYSYDTETGIITIENIETDKDISISTFERYNVDEKGLIYIGGTLKKDIEYNLDNTLILDGVEDIEISIKELETFNPINGITIKDDNTTFDDIEVIGNIKKPSPGENKTSTITYRIKDKNNNTKDINRKITVTNQIPTITGLEDIIIEKGEEVDLLEDVKSTDYEDKNITQNIQISNIDISKLSIGTHKVYYSITDSDKNKISKARNITINPPSIELNAIPQIIGCKDITIKKNQTIDLKEGITAIDKEDGDITHHIKIKGNIDISKIGTQKITYSVVDSKGNEVEMSRNIKIKI